MKITSRDNQKLKNARKVRDGKFEDLIFVEGLRLAEECLRSGIDIADAFYTEEFGRKERGAELIIDLQARKAEIFEVSDQLISSLADTKTSQGIVLIAKKPITGKAVLETKLGLKTSDIPVFIVLHEINNPNNLGAIFRTAEAADAFGIILTENSADAFSPKSIRASMGSAFRLPVWENAVFSDVLGWAYNHGLNSVCSDITADKSFLDFDWKRPALIVFGSESHGLSNLEFQQISESVRIPMDNGVESLNLAVSCGILLYESKRQNHR